MEITYDNLKSILLSEKLEGNVLKCQFKAANQDTPVEAQFVFVPDEKDVMVNAGKQAVKRSFFSSIVSVFSGAASSAAGGGMAGGAVGSAVSATSHGVYNAQEDPNALTKINITDEKRKQGVVNAFKNVQSMYIYENGTWSCKQ